MIGLVGFSSWTICVTHQHLVLGAIDVIRYHREAVARRGFRLVAVEWGRAGPLHIRDAVWLKFQKGDLP